MRKSILKQFLFQFCLFALIISTNFSLQGAVSKEEDVNVLLITIDTIRPDRLSCYSTKYLKTPRIENLALEGFVFDRAFAHNPTTLPSHVNIFLGVTPLYHGVHDNSKFKVSEDFITLAELLKDNEYSTGAFIGAFPLDSRFGLSQGFDVYDESYPSVSSYAFASAERKAEEVIEAALDWLKRQKSKWFSWIHLWDPHTIYSPPEPFKSRFKDDLYSGEVAYVDSELGKLFDYLKNGDLLDNTLIVLTGDHGESLGEHGELTHSYFAYNSTLWVPLIFFGPGLISGSTAEYVCHIDIFPTICDILKIKKPSFLQGISLFPLLKGKKMKNVERRAIYFESLDPFLNRGCAPLRGFIGEKKKYFYSPLPEFYDLEKDFSEENNLVEEVNLEKYEKRFKELMEELSSNRVGNTFSIVDREKQEKLRSLGYVASFAPQFKENYGTEDDVKTLFPFQQKLDKAIILFDGGKVEESIRSLNEIIEKKKNMAPAYLTLNHIYKEQKQFEKALKVLEDGYESNPKNYDIVSNFGILLIDYGELDKGIKILQQGLAMIDFDPDVLNYLGFAHLRKGEEQKALEYFHKTLELDNNHAEAYSNLGALYFSRFARTRTREDLAQAMEYLKKAIERNPTLVVAYRGLGQGYRIAGRVDYAIDVWEQGLGYGPEDEFIVLNLGRSYLETGNKTKALEYLEKYLSLKGQTITPEEKKEIETLIEKCKK